LFLLLELERDQQCPTNNAPRLPCRCGLRKSKRKAGAASESGERGGVGLAFISKTGAKNRSIYRHRHSLAFASSLSRVAFVLRGYFIAQIAPPPHKNGSINGSIAATAQLHSIAATAQLHSIAVS
jgi:hypothetical protein